MPSTPSPAAFRSSPQLDADLLTICRSTAFLARTRPSDEEAVFAGLDLIERVVAPLAPRIKQAKVDAAMKRSARRYYARQQAKADAADAAAQIKEALSR